MKSSASTVHGYLTELPEDRRKALEAVRRTIRKHLPKGYEETMQSGMIGYVVPLKRYPETYNRQPMLYAALASQKNYMVVYLNNVYSSPVIEAWFREAYRATGKRLDMGKSCVRFRTLDDLPLDLIGEAIGRTSLDEFISLYEAAHGATSPKR